MSTPLDSPEFSAEELARAEALVHEAAAGPESSIVRVSYVWARQLTPDECNLMARYLAKRFPCRGRQ